MIKARSTAKGVIHFTLNNSIEAMFLTDFKQVNIFYNKERIETLNTENMPVSYFFNKLLSYGK